MKQTAIATEGSPNEDGNEKPRKREKLLIH